jgi:hypothetical protein
MISIAVFAYRPQPASASEVLDKLQAEAISGMVSAPAPGCGAPPDRGAQSAGGVIAFQTGPANGPTGPSAPTGPTTLTNPNELSDKLATVLGVSGDRVRAAMLATVRADLPASLPPDPMDAIASQLGVSREAVCAAFLDGQGAITGFRVSNGGPGESGPASLHTDANMINLNAVTADQLKDQARKLGVSPDRLAAAVKAAVAPLLAQPEPPKLPSPDEIIHQFAVNLGLPEDRVRAAIQRVEGSNGFYFAVPLPALSH